jgi:hypothetical protein
MGKACESATTQRNQSKRHDKSKSTEIQAASEKEEGSGKEAAKIEAYTL